MSKRRGSPRFSTAWRKFVRTTDLARLDIDPSKVFGDVRDRHEGRVPDVTVTPDRELDDVREEQ